MHQDNQQMSYILSRFVSSMYETIDQKNGNGNKSNLQLWKDGIFYQEYQPNLVFISSNAIKKCSAKSFNIQQLFAEIELNNCCGIYHHLETKI